MLGRAAVVAPWRQHEGLGLASATYEAADGYGRPGDADLSKRADRQVVERPKIAIDHIIGGGLDFGRQRRAINPGTFSGSRIFLACSFFGPFELGLDHLTAVGSVCAEFTTTDQRDGRLLGRGIRYRDSCESRHQYCWNSQPLDHL